MKRFVWIFTAAISAAGFSGCTVGSSEDGTGERVSPELRSEMESNIDFEATQRLLDSRGEVLRLNEAIVIYDDSDNTSGGVLVIVPVVRKLDNKPGADLQVLFEHRPGSNPMVLVTPNKTSFPQLNPLQNNCVWVYEEDSGTWTDECTTGGGGGGGGGGGLPICGYFNNSNTCRPFSGQLTGQVCVGGAPLRQYDRHRRDYYTNGRDVYHENYEFSC